jgi:hypothetical protein
MGVEQNRPIFTPLTPKRVLGRHREIAGGDKLASRRRRDAMHLRDHRLGQAADHLHHRRAAVEEVAQRHRAAVVGCRLAVISLRSWPAQNALPSPRSTITTRCGVGLLQARERRCQFRQHRVGQGVQVARRIHRQVGHRALILAQQKRLAHPGLSLVLCHGPRQVSGKTGGGEQGRQWAS